MPVEETEVIEPHLVVWLLRGGNMRGIQVVANVRVVETVTSGVVQAYFIRVHSVVFAPHYFFKSYHSYF